MTLRQEYAKAAMQAMLSRDAPGVHELAAAAFAIADAMLMREKVEQEDMERRRNQ